MGRNYKATYGNTGRKGPIGPRPTALLRWKALPYVIWNLLHNKDEGGFVPPNYDDFAFIAAYKAETDAQNVALDGDILNLMPKGTITATSIHSTPILALDYQGIYQEYDVDDPVWAGGRKDGVTTYATNPDGSLIDPHPWLQANDAATNLLFPSSPRTGLTITGGALDLDHADIFGGLSGAIFTEAANINIHGVYSVVSTTGAKTVTIYYKPTSGQFVNFSLTTSDSKHFVITVDLNAVTITKQEVTNTADYNKAEIEKIGEFVRVSLSTNSDIAYLISSTSDTGTPIYNYDGWVNYGADGTRNFHIGHMQMEDGRAFSSPIITTTAAASIPQLDYTYPAANIDPADSHIQFDFLADGRDCDILNIGGVPLLSYGDAGDGTELNLSPTFDDWADPTIPDGWVSSAQTPGTTYAEEGVAGGFRLVTDGAYVLLRQTNSIVIGEVYVVTYEYSDRASGGLSLEGVGEILLTASVGVRTTIVTTANGTYIGIKRTGGVTDCTLSYLSVQKATKGLILNDGSGNILTMPVADGTRSIEVYLMSDNTMQLVADGVSSAIIDYAPIAPGEIVSNATHYDLRRSDGPFFPFGSEEVINGDFENGDAGWTGLNVAGGVANTVSTTGYQVINTIAGQDYSVNFECDAKGVSPQLQIQNGNTTGSPVIAEVNPSGNGVMVPYSTTFTALDVESIVILSNGSNTALWDNVSIKRINTV